MGERYGGLVVQQNALPGARVSGEDQDARNLTRLGFAAIEAGNIAAHEALVFKAQRDKVFVRDLFNQAQDQVRDHMAAALLTKGQEAIYQPEKTEKFFDDMIGQYTKLMDPRQNELFGVAVADLRDSNLNQITRHSRAALVEYDKITKEVNITNAIDRAKQNQAELSNSEFTIEAETADIWKDYGPDVIASKTAAGVDLLYAGVTDHLAATSTEAALEFAASHKDKFLPSSWAKVEEQLVPKARSERAENAALNLFSTFKDAREEAFNDARSITDPLFRKEVLQRLEYHFNQQAQIDRKAHEDLINDAYEQADALIAQGLTTPEIVAQIPKELPYTDLINLRTYVDKRTLGEGTSDDLLFENLWNLSLDQPAEFMRTDLGQFRAALGHANFKSLLERRKQIVAADKSEEEKRRNDTTVTKGTFIRDTVKKIDPKAKLDGRETATLTRMIREAIEASDKPDDENTWAEIADLYLMKVDTGFWGVRNIPYGRALAQDKPAGSFSKEPPYYVPAGSKRFDKKVNGVQYQGWLDKATNTLYTLDHRVLPLSPDGKEIGGNGYKWVTNVEHEGVVYSGGFYNASTFDFQPYEPEQE